MSSKIGRRLRSQSIMVDNLEKIIPLLSFESEDDFYFLQLLQRKKDNDLPTANSHVIKNYYINSVESLELIYPEIQSLCKKFNARASLRLNKRSYEKIAYQTLLSVTNTIMNKDFKSVRKTYDRCCGQFNNEPNKKWILDIDDKTTDLERVKTAVKFCMPNEGEDKVYCVMPTKSGFHVITKPFNVEQFARTSRLSIDIHKDNPVNLFIP